MIQWLETFGLSFIQGVTEFLPISSSAHLIIPSLLSPQIAERGLLFDAALHGGTLIAVLVFFRRDISHLISGVFKGGAARYQIMFLCIASLPVLITGFLTVNFLPKLHTLPVIGITTIFFGLLLWQASLIAKGKETTYTHSVNQKTNLQEVTLLCALGIGFGQVAALVPGVSRSGITMTCGMWFGLSQQTAARFSFLLAIPVIGAAACYSIYRLLVDYVSLGVQSGGQWLHALVGAVFAGILAYMTIGFFLRLVQKAGMLPFVLYRVVLGVVLLAYWQWFII